MKLPPEITRRLLRPTWIEVDLDAIEHNVKSLKKHLGNIKLIGVLKGDACGFGLEECGVAMASAGADMLAVANPFEVTVLRNYGINIPILLFASYPPELASEIVKIDVYPTLVDFDAARAFADAAKASLSKPLNVFIKVDTGLGRLGIPFQEAIHLVKFVSEIPQLKIAGIYSHAGGSSDQRAEVQFERFKHLLSETDRLGITVPIRMIASTPFVLQHPHMWLNGVDPGRLLFGIKHPPDVSVRHLPIRSALRGFRTRIIQVKPVTAEDPLEYGYERSGKKRQYGILPFGWVDTFLPTIYSKSGALVRGIKVPFLNKTFSAEHSVLDLTEVPDARPGDTVTLIGKDENASIELAHIAEKGDVLISEITRRFHRHLSCIYYKANKPVKVKTLTGGCTLLD